MNISNNSLFVGNSTTRLGGGSHLLQDNEAARIGKIIACSIIMVVALVGNILVIIVVCRNANMRKTINYFIVNMSVSDLAIPIFVLPRVIFENASPHHAPYLWEIHGVAGLVSCKCVLFISDISPIVSIFSLICITVDRFCAVVFPMKRTLMTSRVRLVLIVLTWIFSAAIFSPYFYFVTLVRFPRFHEGTFCRLRWSTNVYRQVAMQRAFFTANCILFVIIPVILLTVMYTAIMVVVRLAFLSRMGQQGNAAQRRQQSKNTKLLRLAVLTVVSFAVCWGPYNVYLFVQGFVWKWQKPMTGGLRVFSDVATFFTYIHSMINPCLYFLFIENYRRGLRRVLTVSGFESRVTLQSRLIEATGSMRRAGSRRTRNVVTSNSTEQLEERGANASSELLVMQSLGNKQSP